MLAQAGIPLTGGFVAKLEVFAAAADAGEYVLLVIGVLAAVVAAFVYLRVAITMLTAPDDGEPTSRHGALPRRSTPGRAVVTRRHCSAHDPR